MNKWTWQDREGFRMNMIEAGGSTNCAGDMTRYPRTNAKRALNARSLVPLTIVFRAWAQGQDFVLTDVPFATLEEMDAAYMFLAQSGVIMNDSYLPEQKIASAKSRK